MTERMKPSGFDYLGNIPASWDVKRFKYCVQICNGGEYADIEVEEGGYPVIGSGGEFARASKYCYRGESVLLGRKGTVDKPLYVNDAFWCVDTMFYTKAKAGMVPKFLYYCALGFRFDYYVTATALPSMTQKDLGSEMIAVPPTDEQHAIADYLDVQCAKIDRVIADSEKQIETLQKYKKSLITEAVTKGLERSVPMKDSGFDWVPEIPTSWCVDRLGNISNLRNGYVGPTKDILVDEGEPYIQSLHVKNGKIVFGEDFYVTAAWGKHHPKITKGDILLVQTGEIGQIALVDERYDGCNCHALIICSPDAKRVYPAYLLYYLMSSVGNSQLMIYETGTTLKHLNSTKIKNSKVIIPPVEVQKEIAEHLDVKTKQIDAIIETKQKQIDTMLSHKRSLIYEYVTGKKRVTEVN